MNPSSLGSDGYIGLAVHQAARIGDAGHGGQVLISSTTANLVRSELPGDVRLALAVPNDPESIRPLLHPAHERLPSNLADHGSSVAEPPGP